MTFAVVILALSVAGSSALAVWLAMMNKKLSILNGQLAERAASNAADRALAEDKYGRSERVIAMLKDELATLQDELALCTAPGAVRSRLRRMLQAAASHSHSNVGPMPDGAAPADSGEPESGRP